MNYLVDNKYHALIFINQTKATITLLYHTLFEYTHTLRLIANYLPFLVGFRILLNEKNAFSFTNAHKMRIK